MKISRTVAIASGACVAAIVALGLNHERFADYLDRRRIDRENLATLNEVMSKDSLAVQVWKSIDQSVVQPLVPERAYLQVPFFCQSPFPTEASWHFHHASCEEAAALQAIYYYQGISNIDLNVVDRTLRDMVAWQEKHFGVHKDIHADTLKMHLMAFFGLEDDEVVILRKAAILDIKKWVAKGHPVIAPTYGRILGNPYYQRPGPEYHMVTVIGYTKDRIITNDVGTKRGKDFSYAVDVFKRSMDREGADCLVIVPKNDRLRTR